MCKVIRHLQSVPNDFLLTPSNVLLGCLILNDYFFNVNSFYDEINHNKLIKSSVYISHL